MSLQRKSARALELSGSFRKNPQRKRVDTKSDGAIPAYRRGPVDVGSIYNEICRSAPPNLLRRADAHAVELLSIALSEARKHPEDLTAGQISAITSLLHKLGCTPSGRQNIDAPIASTPDKNAKTAAENDRVQRVLEKHFSQD
jgi:hypothetical protein